MAELKWYGDRGFLQVESEGVYNEDYFKKYEGYAKTELGAKINSARKGLVSTFVDPDVMVLDVGIGSGQFVAGRPNTLGFDVNPAGIKWLMERNLYMDPYSMNVSHMTFWDSLEHIESPTHILDRCLDLVFVSIPIFRNREHVLKSKHYRPDEHYHYFTHEGFVRYMEEHGFKCLQFDDYESRLGREDILTFVFKRSFK